MTHRCSCGHGDCFGAHPSDRAGALRAEPLRVSGKAAHPLRDAVPPLVHLIAIVLMVLIWAAWLYATLKLEGAV